MPVAVRKTRSRAARTARSLARAVLVEVHEEVRLDERPVVEVADVRVAVVVPHQPRHPARHVVGEARLGEKPARRRRSLLLLQAAVAASVPLLRRVDADVVDDRGGLQREQRRVAHALAEPDGPGKAVHLEEVLDAAGVARVEADHREHKPVQQRVSGGHGAPPRQRPRGGLPAPILGFRRPPVADRSPAAATSSRPVPRPRASGATTSTCSTWTSRGPAPARHGACA